MTKTYVTYREFGAKGDGKTDDMAAIVACHDYANRNGLPVRVDGGEYYIGGKAMTAYIRTDTDFGSAKFILDDRNLEDITQCCFAIVGDGERFVPAIRTISRNQKRMEFPHEGNVYVRVFSDRKVYIRKGLNQNSGTDASDCFVVDGDGNVTCGINWDHGTITKAYAFSADDAPITVRGGIFTTVANQAESKYNYHNRNILISRSNVTVENIPHHITGEMDHGAPYHGFLTVEECANVTLRNCLLTPHKIYYTQSKLPGQMVPMGSYDLSCEAVVGLRMERITQSIHICNEDYWGLMGSNFCKQLYLDGCVMSRFDAHCGVTDGGIHNCHLGFAGVNLIGFGDFYITDTKIEGSYDMVGLRSDYGSNFDGKLTIRNVVYKPHLRENGDYALLRGHNTGDHDFGYPCRMPHTVVMEHVVLDDGDLEGEYTLSAIERYDPDYVPGKPFPYQPPKSVTVADVRSTSGKPVAVYAAPEQFDGVQTRVL